MKLPAQFLSSLTNRTSRPQFSSSFNMAWRSHGEDNRSMVESLLGNNIIQTEAVKNVMMQVDRGHYIGRNAYMDETPREVRSFSFFAPP